MISDNIIVYFLVIYLTRNLNDTDPASIPISRIDEISPKSLDYYCWSIDLKFIVIYEINNALKRVSKASVSELIPYPRLNIAKHELKVKAQKYIWEWEIYSLSYNFIKYKYIKKISHKIIYKIFFILLIQSP